MNKQSPFLNLLGTAFLMILSSCASHPPVVGTGVDRGAINAVVQRHRSEIRNCYDLALKTNPKAKGRIAFGFRIEPDGKISKISLGENAVKSEELPDCIMNCIKEWTFPKAEAPTEIHAYPFYLNPGR